MRKFATVRIYFDPKKITFEQSVKLGKIMETGDSANADEVSLGKSDEMLYLERQYVRADGEDRFKIRKSLREFLKENKDIKDYVKYEWKEMEEDNE